MTRPHPIVGIAAKLAYGRGRCTYQPHIAEGFVQIEEVLVPVIGGRDTGRVEFAVQALEC